MNDGAAYGSPLLAPIFASVAMRATFSDGATLQAMLDFEAALARAEADAGVIPQETAGPIAEACIAGFYDPAAIGAAAPAGGNIAIPLVKALTAKVPEAARGWVHWGATSQDAIDTAAMLLARDGLAILRRDLRAAMEACAALAEAHRATLMPGRTWLQQALPISFGFKAATWLGGLIDAHRRLRRAESEALALQFGGASGTLAALGDKGTEVRRRLAALLRLAEPPVTWHTERGRILEIAAALAGLSGAASKIATDVLLLMQSEVGETFEPAASGKGGSSTMPHKRNPVGAAAIRANHRRVAGIMATLTMAMEQEHERAPGGWSAEWETMRDLFVLAGGSVERLAEMLGGLELDTERMRSNLDAQRGLPLAESLMMALAPAIGRMQAHHRVEAASKRALAAGCTLADIARSEPAIASHLSAEEIDRALDPNHYLGTAGTMIDAALAAARSEMEKA